MVTKIVAIHYYKYYQTILKFAIINHQHEITLHFSVFIIVIDHSRFT